MGGVKQWQWPWQAIAGAVVVAATVIGLLGLNGAVDGLQERVRELEGATHKIEVIQHHIAELRKEANDLARFRDDILQAICAANAHGRADLRQCYRHVGGSP